MVAQAFKAADKSTNGTLESCSKRATEISLEEEMRDTYQQVVSPSTIAALDLACTSTLRQIIPKYARGEVDGRKRKGRGEGKKSFKKKVI